ncbi:receptor kinase-like protein Xa21 isoform X2 [Cajanus cajan]|uniref:receptor kinase-like protein Xa21 isoform X2 n=1 Tax=Cajanus cajan TaxID=3821 RepID=UPI0010FB05A7|nr:receptor kinase-like protein Xa21 isoform X2 [Cajanus cajan]
MALAVIMFLLIVVSQTMVYMTPCTVGLALSSESDKLALLALKQNLTNGVPDALPSWNQSLHFCEWQGVTCSQRHMRVSVLHLENQNWGGTLGPSLAKLTFLRMLILSNMNLHGEIPTQVGRLKRLQLLDLSHNNLHGSLENRYVKVSYGELHEATNGFSSSNLVGTGSFGSVYGGSLLHFARPIAVKVLNLEKGGASKSFTAECKALGKIKHRNLLNIVTCCSSIDYNGNDFKAIVFELMPNGSLESLLHNNEELGSRIFDLNPQHRINIALDVANALDYLHNGSEEPVVHCDIKPSNVLLDNDNVAHLGDFGLARLLNVVTGHSSRDRVSSSAIRGTIGYVPPEYGAGVHVSAKGDIYSYGILVLEMLTGKKPTDNMFGEGLSLHKFCENAIPDRIIEIVDSRLLVSSAEEGTRVMERTIGECLVSFARIGVACAAELPNQRMDIKDVIVELQAIKRKLP